MSFKLNPFKLINFLIENDLILPVTLLFIYFIFLFIIKGAIPNADELVKISSVLYAKYGYEIIFVSALLESLVLINFVVPGQLAMVLGVIFARTGQTSLPLVLITATIGAILGYIIDYFLGYFGFSNLLKKTSYQPLIKTSQDKIKKFGSRGLILSFIHTNIGAFASIAAGFLMFDFTSFLIIAFFSTLAWSLVWGALVYSFGNIILTVIKKYSFLLMIAFVTWIMVSKIWSNNKK